MGASFNSLFVGILTFLAEAALFYTIIILLARKKENDPIEYMNSISIPEDSRPKYVFSLEEVLARLDQEITYE